MKLIMWRVVRLWHIKEMRHDMHEGQHDDPSQCHAKRSNESACRYPQAPRRRRGGALLVEETADGVVLRTVAQSIAQAQALARQYTAGRSEVSVDTFIANRKADSGE